MTPFLLHSGSEDLVRIEIGSRDEGGLGDGAPSH
jgi:hypothetical protein